MRSHSIVHSLQVLDGISFSRVVFQSLCGGLCCINIAFDPMICQIAYRNLNGTQHAIQLSKAERF